MKLPKFPPGPMADWMKKLEGARPPDATAIGQTIERALASAGLDTRGGAMKSLQRHMQQALDGAAAGAERAAQAFREAVTEPGTAGGPVPVLPGEFTRRSYTSLVGSRDYRLYVPSSYASSAAQAVPLVVMLHGCKQSAEDFAAGTRMNELAERHGFLVAYPEQAPKANGSRCWNWFQAGDQGRDGGEPALIAGIAHEVAGGFRIDRGRIFVAGLSAGAAMSVILGQAYPEIFAAIGVHSGLPLGAARDVPSAFAAMKGQGRGPASGVRHAVPTIVFHGDQDATVALSNGQAVASQALLAAQAGAAAPLAAEVTQGEAAGRQYQRTVHVEPGSGRPLVEAWLLHGAGHAWSGGSAHGSFTDAAGPDASAEMLRFFLAQGRALA